MNCKIEGCSRKLYGNQDYCKTHYQKYKLGYVPQRQDIRNAQKGIFCFCGRPQYAKSYCRVHYRNFRVTGSPIIFHSTCKYEGCNKKTKQNDYCSIHLAKINTRIKYGLPFNLKDIRSIVKKGKYNPRWNGGASEYENHADMKRTRKIKLSLNPICEICKKAKASDIHHIDGTKTNHSLNNLIACCHKCHMRTFHKTKKKTSLYRRLYGFTASELSKKLSYGETKIHNLHKKGRLKQLLTPKL